MDEKTRNEIVNSALKGGVDNDITIRVGEAVKAHDIEGVNITGNIDAPLRWIATRNGEYDPLQCYVVADRDAMTIKLVCNEGRHDHDIIVGKLIFSQEMKAFGVNTCLRRSNFDMARFIKMNRSYFETKQIAMELVTTLQNFKAKVEHDMEKADDRRGNTTQFIRQSVIESNLPGGFKLTIPIFKGEKPVTITAEVDIDPDDFSCSLVSPEAADYAHTEVDRIFDDTLAQISNINHDIVIIEQ